MRMIRLADFEDGHPVWINPARVVYVEANEGGKISSSTGTYIYYGPSDEDHIQVLDGVDVVIAAIDEELAR